MTSSVKATKAPAAKAAKAPATKAAKAPRNIKEDVKSFDNVVTTLRALIDQNNKGGVTNSNSKKDFDAMLKGQIISPETVGAMMSMLESAGRPYSNIDSVVGEYYAHQQKAVRKAFEACKFTVKGDFSFFTTKLSANKNAVINLLKEDNFLAKDLHDAIYTGRVGGAWSPYSMMQQAITSLLFLGVIDFASGDYDKKRTVKWTGGDKLKKGVNFDLVLGAMLS